MAAEGSTARGHREGVLPRVYICPHPHPPWSNRLCSPNIALTSCHETSAAYHSSSDQRSQQSVPVLKTQELCVCRITGRPQGGCSLYSWKWPTFLSCLGMKDSSCRRPGPPFSLWLEAHLAQERKLEIYKGKRRGEKAKGSGQQSSFLCELPTCLFDLESSLPLATRSVIETPSKCEVHCTIGWPLLVTLTLQQCHFHFPLSASVTCLRTFACVLPWDQSTHSFGNRSPPPLSSEAPF